jgi:hypothetical protein
MIRIETLGLLLNPQSPFGLDLSVAATPRRYAFRKVSRSALIVSASVVGMPWGKPL